MIAPVAAVVGHDFSAIGTVTKSPGWPLAPITLSTVPDTRGTVYVLVLRFRSS